MAEFQKTSINGITNYRFEQMEDEDYVLLAVEFWSQSVRA